jgi:hypothetical protein
MIQRAQASGLAAAYRLGDQAVDLAAIHKIRSIAEHINALAHQAQQLVEAFPTLGVNSTTFNAIRGQVGLACWELELALAALPLDLVAGERAAESEKR